MQLVPQPDEKSQYGLDVILVGERSDSKLYVSMKSKKLAEYGIHVNVHHFESDVVENELIETINSLNRSRTTLGIMIQLPLPEHLNTQIICDTIDPKKDIDGLIVLILVELLQIRLFLNHVLLRELCKF